MDILDNKDFWKAQSDQAIAHNTLVAWLENNGIMFENVREMILALEESSQRFAIERFKVRATAIFGEG